MKDNSIGMVKTCKWSCGILEYDGLCSHSTLREAVPGDFSLSAEELEVKAAEIVKRTKENQYRYLNVVEAEGPVNFLTNQREIQDNFYEKNPSRDAKNLKSSCKMS